MLYNTVLITAFYAFGLVQNVLYKFMDNLDYQNLDILSAILTHYWEKTSEIKYNEGQRD